MKINKVGFNGIPSNSIEKPVSKYKTYKYTSEDYLHRRRSEESDAYEADCGTPSKYKDRESRGKRSEIFGFQGSSRICSSRKRNVKRSTWECASDYRRETPCGSW